MATALSSPVRLGRRRMGRGRWLALAILPVAPLAAALVVQGGEPEAVHFYSTAAPPTDYPGPAPAPASRRLAEPEPTAPKAIEPRAIEPRAIEPETAAEPTTPAREVEPMRIASAGAAAPRVPLMPAPSATALPAVAPDPIDEAKAAIASCKATYAALRDYTCSFYKRERIDGRLSSHHHMQMKARTKPSSIYFKFVKPTPGREAIYVAGGYGGKALVHDVGIGKLLAGTLKVDPRGSMAMDGNLHPITEAGIGHLIDTIVDAWRKELRKGESRVVLHHNAKVGDRPCLMIESVHPKQRPGYLYHKVKVYVDREHNLPIRFEAYDWPRNGRAAELVEEYTYANLRLNVGLTGRDFDPSNASYSFGRF